MEYRRTMDPNVGMLIPEGMVDAALALQNIADGRGTVADIAELMLAANQADPDGDLVGADEVDRALKTIELERQEARARGDSATASRRAMYASHLHERWQAVLQRKIPGGAR